MRNRPIHILLSLTAASAAAHPAYSYALQEDLG